MISGIGSGTFLSDNMTSTRESKVDGVPKGEDTFTKHFKHEKADFPYSSLAKGGMVEYNGVVFVGDPKTNSLNLGDMSQTNRILHIQLSGGGLLNVNYDNIGDLKDAIGMFSGKDKGIILKAVSTHHYEQGFVKAAEDEEEEVVEEMGEQNSGENKASLSEENEPKSEAEISMEMMKQAGNQVYEKLVNNHEEQIEVGPSKMTVIKWD